MEVGRSSVGGSRGWTSKLQSGSMSIINSLMEIKRGCGPELVTDMILRFKTDYLSKPRWRMLICHFKCPTGWLNYKFIKGK